MCQIQLIKKSSGKINKKDLFNFTKLMKNGSIGNRDAWGYFNGNCFFKSSGEFEEKTFREHMPSVENIKSKFIVGHNRFATGNNFHFTSPFNTSFNAPFNPGFVASFNKEDPLMNKDDKKKRMKKKENENNHPFVFGDLTLVHNGVINNDMELRKKYNIHSTIKTDSFVIVWLIDYFLRSFCSDEGRSLLGKGGQKRIKDVVEAIQYCSKELKGYYSVCFFDEVSQKLFYFIGGSAIFYFCVDEKGDLYGSTSKYNLRKICRVKNVEYFDAEKDTIYLLEPKEGFPLQKIGFINEKRVVIDCMKKMSVPMKEGFVEKQLKSLFNFLPKSYVNIRDSKQILNIVLESPEIKEVIIEILNKKGIPYLLKQGKQNLRCWNGRNGEKIKIELDKFG